MKVLIGGDFLPINRPQERLSAGKTLWGQELQSLIDSVDYFTVNLECPITDSLCAIKKTGPNLKVPTSIKEGLKNSGIDFFCLANNHIMDFGVEGLTDTETVLIDAGIEYYGVKTKKADKPYHIIQKDDVKVAFYAVSNNEFSHKKYFDNRGSYSINELALIRDIQTLKKTVNHVVIVLHIGIIYFPLPYDEQKELSRILVELGCTLVLSQHSHIIGCFESFGNGFISYGAGNLLFDKEKAHYNYSQVFELDFSKDSFELNIHYTEQELADNALVEIMNTSKRIELEQEYEKLTPALDNALLYESLLEKHISNYSRGVLNGMLVPTNKWLQRIARRLNIIKLIPMSVKMSILNTLRCKELNVIMIRILENEVYNKNSN